MPPPDPAGDEPVDPGALADLVELVGDDAEGRAAIARMAATLFDDDGTLRRLADAVTAADAGTVADEAHRLKGRARALGCLVLAGHAATLEGLGRDAAASWTGEAGAVLPLLADAWQRAGGAIAEWLGAWRPGGDHP